MKKHINNYILAVCSAVLVFLCIKSIYTPIHFDNERGIREREVRARLIIIRRAQEAYRRATGSYCNSFQKLISRGLLTDSLRFIPYSEGNEFYLRTATITTASGRKVAVMECGATYDDYLTGLDPDAVTALEEKADMTGGFPGLRIGDIEKNNENAGNWE